jgi:hypothetical protein
VKRKSQIFHAINRFKIFKRFNMGEIHRRLGKCARRDARLAYLASTAHILDTVGGWSQFPRNWQELRHLI